MWWHGITGYPRPKHLGCQYGLLRSIAVAFNASSSLFLSSVFPSQVPEAFTSLTVLVSYPGTRVFTLAAVRLCWVKWSLTTPILCIGPHRVALHRVPKVDTSLTYKTISMIQPCIPRKYFLTGVPSSHTALTLRTLCIPGRHRRPKLANDACNMASTAFDTCQGC